MINRWSFMKHVAKLSLCLLSNKFTVELGYNVMKETEYFVSL
jgi:hypothetical protein